MLRITTSTSAAGAKKYYTESYYREGMGMGMDLDKGLVNGLNGVASRAEYYAEKDQIIGNWHGKAAGLLGLGGELKKSDFDSLCDNLHPISGKRLTGRFNANRRVGYDFTFNASKSVSLAYAFADEKGKAEILTAFRASVREAMKEVEGGMQARVRAGGLNENRETGNLVYGEFIHFTSRPVKGIADPHLHSHCFILNATRDGVENKWKAGEFGQIKKDAPYYEAVFHSAFANKLQGLGYGVKKCKVGFELAGVDRSLVEKFSNRTREIEKLAAEKGITDDKRKSELGARTRESKRAVVSGVEEFAVWESRLSEAEKAAFVTLKNSVGANDNFNVGVAKDSVDFSLAHHLERKSVTTDKEVLTLAIKDSLGKGVSWKEVKSGLKDSGEVITVREDLVNYVTTHSALQEENNLIRAAHDFKGRFKPLNKEYDPSVDYLNKEQLRAIQNALTTNDGITIIAGKAGTGKTTLMKEVQKGILSGGKEIFAFAPSAEASRGVQRSEGFANANTIAALVQNKELQRKIQGNVLWVDEAGMVGVRDMNAILSIAKENKARLILSGDTKQHNSVERGDALRILQSEAGIAPVQVNQIQRQKSKEYRQAVSLLSRGEVVKGFNKLDKMGAVKEIDDDGKRVAAIANDYFESAYKLNYNGDTKGNAKHKKPASVLVVSPTHKEGDAVTAAIRQRLQAEGVVEDKEKQFLTFKKTQFTQAQMAKPENYEVGNFVVFHQNVKGFKAGGRFEVVEHNENQNNEKNKKQGEKQDKQQVWVKDSAGNEKLLPLGKVKAFQLYKAKELAIAKGDKIRITDNGKTNEGKHLFNGTSFLVDGFDRAGNIKLSNGSVLSKEYGHFALGYVMTSHSSQGKTVDKVIISQSNESMRASSMEQFYVSVSRGRKSVAVYTDDKQDLLQAVSQSNERKSARELVGANKDINKNIGADMQRKRLMERIRNKAYAAYQSTKKIMDYGFQRKISRTK